MMDRDRLPTKLKNDAILEAVVEIRFEPTRAAAVQKQLVIRTDLDDEKVTVTVQGNAG